jgi:hypothetical protein
MEPPTLPFPSTLPPLYKRLAKPLSPSPAELTLPHLSLSLTRPSAATIRRPGRAPEPHQPRPRRAPSTPAEPLPSAPDGAPAFRARVEPLPSWPRPTSQTSVHPRLKTTRIFINFQKSRFELFHEFCNCCCNLAIL